jgi:GDPmannose 4,6-dehydratase
MPKALITGISGQDGSYLAEYLLSLGYEVHGLIRRSSSSNRGRIQHLIDDHNLRGRFYLHYSELSDSSSLTNYCYQIKPDETYNLGAQSHVRVSFEIPEGTGDVTGLSTVRLLEAIRKSRIETKYYQASSSEMFGSAKPPQNENTPFHPRSPYAVSKIYSYWITVNYRESYDMFACNGILFNHESPRRGSTFVTKKITTSLAKILIGKQDILFLGNLDAKRDWGFAPDYVMAMHAMLQQESPKDLVIGTGTAHSVRDFVELAFSYAGIEIEWKGEGLEEVGIIKSTTNLYPNIDLKPGYEIVKIDPWYFRPAEVDYLLADYYRAKTTLNWQPKISFEELVRIMVNYDLQYYNLKTDSDYNNILIDKGITWTTNQIEAGRI